MTQVGQIQVCIPTLEDLFSSKALINNKYPRQLEVGFIGYPNKIPLEGPALVICLLPLT